MEILHVMDNMTPPAGAIVLQPRIRGHRWRGAGQSEIRQLGDCAWVSLSRGLWTVIDAADVPTVAGRSWHARPATGSTGYYAVHTIGRNQVQMHCAILAPVSGNVCDHRDGNGLNNRRTNLRECTSTQNSYNRRRVGSTGFKGVSFRRQTNNWQARIVADGKRKSLGYFDTPEAAHAAYAAAAIRHHGEFARVNWP